MIKSSILPADTYIVINRTLLSDKDRNILIMLYQPLIGSIAISLYYTLWSYLDKLEIMSSEWTHHHLMGNLRIKLEEILEAREKLEAIGLLKTYVKKNGTKNYIYELYSPLSAHEFLNNPILATSLYNNIGKIEYEKTIQYFQNYTVDLKDYENITCSFSEIFEPVAITSYELLNDDIKRSNKRNLDIISKIDLNDVFALIPEELFNIRSLNRETKDLLIKLSFIYNLNEEMLNEIIRNSLTEKRTIDKELLRKNARRYYQFENGGKLPSIIFRNQPEYLRKPVGDTSKRAKMIYAFETTSPYDFLTSKYNGGKPTKTDLGILEFLLIDLNLNPGVVNVLIDFVLRTNNNKLIKSYVETIAGQWKRNNIETVEDAMHLAIEETSKKKTIVRTRKKQEIKPEWFDKEIEEEEMNPEEIQKLEEMLKEFK